MEDKRVFNRWDLCENANAGLSFADQKQTYQVLDISAGGMKLIFSRPINIGSVIYGELKVPSLDNCVIAHVGPFFVRGIVTRAEDKGGKWEIAIRFDKVRGSPFAE